MVKGVEVEVGKSHDRLRAATLHLLDERTPDSVTITDIVKNAGLTRPTFYAVFGDLPTAFADAALSRLQAAFEGVALAVDLAEAKRDDAMAAAFLTILRRVAPHADFFARVLRGPGGTLVHHNLVRFLAERLRRSSPLSPALELGPLPLEVASAAVAAGVTWTFLNWLDDTSRLSTEDMAKQLRDLIAHSIVGGLGRIPTTGLQVEFQE